jgi:DNA-binding SARP family transcriptional activator
MGSDSLKRLAGTYAAPCRVPTLPAWPAVEDMGRPRLAALAAPCDFLALAKVAAVVRERYAEVVWIRLEIADADPGALLVTLLGAIARLDAQESAGIGEAATLRARRGEWALAYQQTARFLAAATARPAVVVLEGAEHLDHTNPATLDLLVSALMPCLQGDLDVLLIGFAAWDSGRLKPHGEVLGPSALRLDRRAAALLADAFRLDLSAAMLDRSFALTHGAAGALEAIFSAGAVLGPEPFSTATAHATTGQELLGVLGRSLLAQADEGSLLALAGASRLGIWHPAMGTALGYPAMQLSDPWWLGLAEDWQQLIPAWRAPLRSAGGPAALGRASLIVLADYLAEQGAGDRALELYVAAGEVDRAAATAVGIARDLASAGGWASLAGLGRVLGRDSAAAEHFAEPDHSRHAAWWCRLFVRWGHRSSGRATGMSGVWPREVVAQAGITQKAAFGSGRQALLGARRAKSRPLAGARAAAVLEAPPAISAHLLGDLRISIGDRPVETWASGRGRAVFEYLLIHRHGKVRRDRLMSVFWPEATPDAARNSLNVALHGLRQSLRAAAGDIAVVIHRDGSYFIEPNLDVWVDVEVFEERLKSAHQHLASAELLSAQADFEAAICLYQDEFLADDPYEEWAAVTREHLRLCYLDSLDWLGRLRLDSGDYNGCVDVCLKLLACDSCREDAQCRLMRCYSRQGQLQLALRQYHCCAAALRQELSVSPAPATTELFNRIRRREDV